MKRFGKILISVFLVLCLCVLPTLSECFAAPYTYTVVVLTGGQGDFVVNGEHTDNLTYSGLKYGDKINLSNAIDSVQLFTDKYYVKGIRLSGHDNSEVSSPVVTVTKDTIYVVAYGIMGDMVNYTVRFQDSAGNVLMPSVTGKGQVGDKPVVAYKYIEGYSPNAYNITGTLGANEAENVFTFTYTKVETPTTTTTVVVNNGTGATNTNNTGNGETGGAGTDGDNGNQATGIDDLEQPFVPVEVTETVESEGTGTGTGSGSGSGDTAGSVQTPVELIDLDDEDVALAAGPGSATDSTDIPSDAKQSHISWLIILAIIIFIILVALLICYIRNKRMRDSEDEDII